MTNMFRELKCQKQYICLTQGQKSVQGIKANIQTFSSSSKLFIYKVRL